MQFQRQYILRDLFKACCGFATSECGFLQEQHNDDKNIISGEEQVIDRILPVASGFWGCGMFGNDKYLKVIQSWIAATACARPLVCIHTFSPDDLRIEEAFNAKIVPVIVKGAVKLGELVNALIEEFPKAKRVEPSLNLFDFINQMFSQKL